MLCVTAIKLGAATLVALYVASCTPNATKVAVPGHDFSRAVFHLLLQCNTYFYSYQTNFNDLPKQSITYKMPMQYVVNSLKLMIIFFTVHHFSYSL